MLSPGYDHAAMDWFKMQTIVAPCTVGRMQYSFERGPAIKCRMDKHATSPRLQDSLAGGVNAPDTPQELLKANPDGAYTTVLIRKGEVVDIESHLKRLSRYHGNIPGFRMCTL